MIPSIFVAGRVEWLEGLVGDEHADHVGWRAIVFARLIRAGVDVPPGFVLPRTLWEACQTVPPGEPLPRSVAQAVDEGWARLGGPAVLRASPLGVPSPSKARSRGGRPEREMYLNLVDAAEVSEAVRRFWSRMREAVPPIPAAAIVQRYIVADIAALVHEPPALKDVLQIESVFGGGDLLAAGLTVPDKSIVEMAGGRVRSRRIGRKPQQSVPRPEGGVRRRTAPPGAAKQSSMSDEVAQALVKLWAQVQDVLGHLSSLSVAIAQGRPWVTSVRLEDQA
jgi:pyruvate,water dikinase